MNVEDVNGIPTHVFSLKADHHARPRNNSLLLVVPGSPGMGHFYIPFATKLFELGRGRYDVAVVSHAGHSPGHIRPSQVDSSRPKNAPTASDMSIRDDKGDNKDWYSLEDQPDCSQARVHSKACLKQGVSLSRWTFNWLVDDTADATKARA